MPTFDIHTRSPGDTQRIVDIHPQEVVKSLFPGQTVMETYGIGGKASRCPQKYSAGAE